MSKTIAIPTEKELEAIPEENWIAWMKAEYNHDCGVPDYFSVTINKEEMGEEHEEHEYVINFKTFCTGLNQTYCDVTPEQYEKIKVGFYNNQLDSNKSDFMKMIEFMGYTKRYPEDDKIYFKQIGKGEDGEDWIWLKGMKDYEFRPDLKWEDLNKVIDYIESLPSTLKTTLEYHSKDEYSYQFVILMQEGVTMTGLKVGESKESKIDAAYKGVMNYINWRNEVEHGKD